MTRPGLTTATQPSGEPLPEPMRVSAGGATPAAAGTARASPAPATAAGTAAASASATVATVATTASVAVVARRRRRREVGEVGARVALGHDLALVDPALHADPAES